MSQCANPTCSEAGKSKCSAFGLVSYCGTSCQKEHWGQHKAACKAARAKAATVTASSAVPTSQGQPTSSSSANGKVIAPTDMANITVDPALVRQLQAIKQQTQNAFQGGNFQVSIQHGQEALKVARQLPEPSKSIESIQLLLNISSAHLQLGQFREADIQSALCVETAERAVETRKRHPHSLDMLSLCLTNRTFMLMNSGKLPEAEETGTKALQIAEGIFGSDDVRLFKSLRSLGLVNARQDKLEEAKAFLSRAYGLTMSKHGPTHNDTQLLADELLQVYMKQKDVPGAEKIAKANLDSILGSGTGITRESNHPMLGEAAAKYGSILASGGKESQAEPLMRLSLRVREKTQGPNSYAVGVTLMALANIREAQRDVTEATEAMLKRALEIFRAHSDSPQSKDHVAHCVEFLRRVRMKRDALAMSKGAMTVEDVDSDDDEGGNAARKKSGGGGAGKGSSPNGYRPPSAVKDEPIPQLDPTDGPSRMQLAAIFFEKQNFKNAQVLLSEAYQIFLQSNGPSHPSTQAAKQNLDIVKHNRTNQLWMEVVEEEFAKLKVGGPEAAKEGAKEDAKGGAPEDAESSLPDDVWVYQPSTEKSCVIS